MFKKYSLFLFFSLLSVASMAQTDVSNSYYDGDMKLNFAKVEIKEIPEKETELKSNRMTKALIDLIKSQHFLLNEEQNKHWLIYHHSFKPSVIKSKEGEVLILRYKFTEDDSPPLKKKNKESLLAGNAVLIHGFKDKQLVILTCSIPDTNPISITIGPCAKLIKDHLNMVITHEEEANPVYIPQI